jgi:hypothetical protein
MADSVYYSLSSLATRTSNCGSVGQSPSNTSIRMPGKEYASPSALARKREDKNAGGTEQTK